MARAPIWKKRSEPRRGILGIIVLLALFAIAAKLYLRYGLTVKNPGWDIQLVLIYHLILLVLPTVFIAAAILFLAIDTLGRIDYLREKFPWLERSLGERRKIGSIVLVAIFLLAAEGLQLYQSEFPDPSIHTRAPPAPQIFAQSSPKRSAHLAILYRDKPLDGLTIHMPDYTGVFSFRYPIQIKNEGHLGTQQIVVRLMFSEVVDLSAREGWESTETSEREFPLELRTYGPVSIEAGDRWLLPRLAGRAIWPVLVNLDVFYGASDPVRAVFRMSGPEQ